MIKQSLTHRIMTGIIRFGTAILCKIDKAELAKVPKEGPLIAYANHIGQLEVPLIFSYLQPRPVTAMAKAESWDNWFFNWLFDVWKLIPVRRGEADMDARRLPEAKALLDDLPAQDVEVAQCGELLGIGKEGGPLDLGGESDFDFPLALGWERESRRQDDFPQSLVKARGKQKKLPVQKGKTSTPLGDPSFAKDHALAPTAQCVAHHRPFLEMHVLQ